MTDLGLGLTEGLKAGASNSVTLSTRGISRRAASSASRFLTTATSARTDIRNPDPDLDIILAISVACFDAQQRSTHLWDSQGGR